MPPENKSITPKDLHAIEGNVNQLDKLLEVALLNTEFADFDTLKIHVLENDKEPQGFDILFSVDKSKLSMSNKYTWRSIYRKRKYFGFAANLTNWKIAQIQNKDWNLVEGTYQKFFFAGEWFYFGIFY